MHCKNSLLLFLWCPVRLWYSPESWLSWQKEEKATHHNNLELKTIYKAELPYISAQVTVSSFTHLCCCDLKATQVNVAVSQAGFGLCNVVFARALIPEQENPLNTHKADDPPVLYLQNILLLLFYSLVYLPLLCPYLTSSPVLYSLSFSFWTRISLFLPPRETKYCCYGNCSQRGERRGSLWDFQCGDRSLYMASSCLRAGR